MSEKIKIWDKRIGIGRELHKIRLSNNVKLWRRYYRGDQWSKNSLFSNGGTYKEPTVDNTVFSNISVIRPSINFERPKITVSAKRKPFQLPDGTVFNTVKSALLLEILINNLYQRLQVKKQVDKCLVDALIGPWGLMQFGYTVKVEKVKKGGKLIEVNDHVLEDSPFAVRVSPLNVIIDPDAQEHDLSDARWIAFKWDKALVDIKANSRYKNTFSLKANGSVDLNDLNDVDRKRFETSDIDRVIGWEIWDKMEQTLITHVEGHNDFLEIKNWPIKYNNFPLETLYFNENPDRLFPISDVDIYRAEQDELNRLKSLQLDHVKRISQRRYEADDSIEESELEKLINGGDGVVARTEGGPGKIAAIPDAAISQDIYLMVRQLKNDILQQAGTASFEQGGVSKFDTATEPALIAQGISVRRNERSATVEDFVHRIVMQLSNISKQTFEDSDFRLSKDNFNRLHQTDPSSLHRVNVPTQSANSFGELSKLGRQIGPDMVEVLLPWFRLSKKDIQGDFDFEVGVGSMRPRNIDDQKKEAITLYQLLANNPFMNGFNATKKILEAFRRPDIEELMKDGKTLAQEQAQSQQGAVQAEIAIKKPKIDADLQKTAMKLAVAREKISADSTISKLQMLLSKIGEDKDASV